MGPSYALVNSPVVRRAADALLRLSRSPDGAQAISALVARTCTALETGDAKQAVSDVEEASAAWAAAGMSTEEANAALSGLRELMDPKSGLLRSRPDRDAVLLTIDYDQMPEGCRKYTALLEVDDQQTDDAFQLNLIDPSLQRLQAEMEAKPAIKDAVRFAKRLELIGSEEERVRSRWQRLSMMPLVAEAKEIADKDDDLRELMAVLEPFQLRLYNATRTAQLRRKLGSKILSAVGDNEPKAITLEFDIFQLIGGLIVLGGLFYGLTQAVTALRGGDAASQLPTYRSGLGSTMPVYSLKGTASGQQ